MSKREPELSTPQGYLAAGVLAVVMVLVLVVAIRSPSSGSTRPFSQTQWLKAQTLDGVQRHRMVDDLLRQYDFKGWSRSEVEDLLGPATWETDSTLAFDAGEHYGRDIDPIRAYSLVFEIDAVGLIDEVTYVCDGPEC